jgi:hypothetical protein
MVELLFPERIAARRVEQERQAALQKKRSVDRLQQDGACMRSMDGSTVLCRSAAVFLSTRVRASRICC